MDTPKCITTHGISKGQQYFYNVHSLVGEPMGKLFYLRDTTYQESSLLNFPGEYMAKLFIDCLGTTCMDQQNQTHAGSGL